MSRLSRSIGNILLRSEALFEQMNREVIPALKDLHLAFDTMNAGVKSYTYADADPSTSLIYIDAAYQFHFVDTTDGSVDIQLPGPAEVFRPLYFWKTSASNSLQFQAPAGSFLETAAGGSPAITLTTNWSRIAFKSDEDNTWARMVA